MVPVTDGETGAVAPRTRCHSSSSCQGGRAVQGRVRSYVAGRRACSLRAYGAYARWSASTAARSASLTARRSAARPLTCGYVPLVSNRGTRSGGVCALTIARGSTLVAVAREARESCHPAERTQVAAADRRAIVAAAKRPMACSRCLAGGQPAWRGPACIASFRGRGNRRGSDVRFPRHRSLLGSASVGEAKSATHERCGSMMVVWDADRDAKEVAW